MGDRLRAGIHLRYVTSHLRQLSFLPSVGREIRISQSAVCAAAGDRRQDDSFHSWISMWVAGKTVSLSRAIMMSTLEVSIVMKRCIMQMSCLDLNLTGTGTWGRQPLLKWTTFHWFSEFFGFLVLTCIAVSFHYLSLWSYYVN